MSCPKDQYRDAHVGKCIPCRNICVISKEPDKDQCQRLCPDYLKRRNSTEKHTTPSSPPDGTIISENVRNWGLIFPCVVLVVLLVIVLIVVLIVRNKKGKQPKKYRGSTEALLSKRINLSQLENNKKMSSSNFVLCYGDKKGSSYFNSEVHNMQQNILNEKLSPCQKNIHKLSENSLPDTILNITSGSMKLSNYQVESENKLPVQTKESQAISTPDKSVIHKKVNSSHSIEVSQMDKKHKFRSVPSREINVSQSNGLQKSLVKPDKPQNPSFHATQPKCMDECSSVHSQSSRSHHRSREPSSYESLKIKQHTSGDRENPKQAQSPVVIHDVIEETNFSLSNSSLFGGSRHHPRTFRRESSWLSLSLRADDIVRTNHQAVEDFLRSASSNHWDSIMNLYELLEANLYKFPWIVGCMITNDHIEVVVDLEKAKLNVNEAYDQLMVVIPDGQEPYIMLSVEGNSTNTQNS